MGFADTKHPDTVICGQGKELCTYKYYILDSDRPIRIAINDKENFIDADVVDKKTRKLEPNIDLLVSIEFTENHEIKEITKDEFYQKCDEYMAYWTPERIEEWEKDIARQEEEWQDSIEELEKLAREAEEKAGIKKKTS